MVSSTVPRTDLNICARIAGIEVGASLICHSLFLLTEELESETEGGRKEELDLAPVTACSLCGCTADARSLFTLGD